MVRPGHVVGLADKGLTPSFVRTGVLSSMPLMSPPPKCSKQHCPTRQGPCGRESVG